MKAFNIILVATSLLLFTGCNGNLSQKANVPVWEFDLTVNGVRSHFKSKGIERDYMWWLQQTSSGAFASANGGDWLINCRGNSTGDDEWLHGNPIDIKLLFDEVSKEVSVVFLGGIASFVDPQSTPVSVTINDFGSRTTVDQTTIEVDFGDPIEISIPQQTFTPTSGTIITISGSIKAIY